MIEVGLTRVYRTILLILTVVFFCPHAYGKVIYVDDEAGADYESIQAGIDAAEKGDTVCVAPGTYYENIVLKNGINLSGAGADFTIIDANGYGDVVDARANDVTISGFTIRNSGQVDLGHMNCGVYLDGNYAPIIRNNVIAHNMIGIGIWEGAKPDIRNNIIRNNYSGFYIYGSEERPSNPAIINNTIVNNEIEGITLRVKVSPVIVNNIIDGHFYGINHNYVTGVPIIHHNNLWLNDVNYLRDNNADDTLAGPGSISVDPYFAEPGYLLDANDPNSLWIEDDYHLKSQAGRWDPNNQSWAVDYITSTCIDAGDPNSPIGHEPFPNGGRINMGAYGGTAEASKSPSGLHAKYGGGTGEPNNPYLIYTAEHLNTISTEPNDCNKHFKLMADIDLAGYSYNQALIAPDVDTDEYYFQGNPYVGIFNGNGHTISNLTITGVSYLGLFGELEFGSTVKDLGVVDVNIIGTGDVVGGLLGHSRFGATIIRCYSTGTVNGDDNIGGLVGSNGGHMRQCYSNSTVNGNYIVGGLLGANEGGADVTNCYSTGVVNGDDAVGGLMGFNLGEVSHCYSAGAVTGSQRLGGLVGWTYGNIVSSFWDIEASGQANMCGSQEEGASGCDDSFGKTTVEMQTVDTFLEAGWDFVDESVNGTEDIWWILEGQDYPRLLEETY